VAERSLNRKRLLYAPAKTGRVVCTTGKSVLRLSWQGDELRGASLVEMQEAVNPSSTMANPS
jgi:hypothetical protein